MKLLPLGLILTAASLLLEQAVLIKKEHELQLR